MHSVLWLDGCAHVKWVVAWNISWLYDGDFGVGGFAVRWGLDSIYRHGGSLISRRHCALVPHLNAE